MEQRRKLLQTVYLEMTTPLGKPEIDEATKAPLPSPLPSSSRWHWLRAPDGSYAMGTVRPSAVADTVLSSTPVVWKPRKNRRKSLSPVGSWHWLLRPDGKHYGSGSVALKESENGNLTADTEGTETKNSAPDGSYATADTTAAVAKKRKRKQNQPEDAESSRKLHRKPFHGKATPIVASKESDSEDFQFDIEESDNEDSLFDDNQDNELRRNIENRISKFRSSRSRSFARMKPESDSEESDSEDSQFENEESDENATPIEASEESDSEDSQLDIEESDDEDSPFDDDQTYEYFRRNIENRISKFRSSRSRSFARMKPESDSEESDSKDSQFDIEESEDEDSLFDNSQDNEFRRNIENRISKFRSSRSRYLAGMKPESDSEESDDEDSLFDEDQDNEFRRNIENRINKFRSSRSVRYKTNPILDDSLEFRKILDHTWHDGTLILQAQYINVEGTPITLSTTLSHLKIYEPIACAKYIRSYILETRRGNRPLNDWADQILKYQYKTIRMKPESDSEESDSEDSQFDIEESDDEDSLFDDDQECEFRRSIENRISKFRCSRSRSLAHMKPEVWEAKFKLLVDYKHKHGTTRVPYHIPILGEWVHRQRRDCNTKKLSEYRRQRLNSIGFEWRIRLPYDIAWMKMYNCLLSYKKHHDGSTSVSRKSKKYKKLAYWVFDQRMNYMKGKLPQKRINLLESIGFEWEPYKNAWITMYYRLVNYKKEYGSTWVPVGFKDDPKLGVWVSKQRYGCKEQYRIDLLNDIGFDWIVKRK